MPRGSEGWDGGDMLEMGGDHVASAGKGALKVTMQNQLFLSGISGKIIWGWRRGKK